MKYWITYLILTVAAFYMSGLQSRYRASKVSAFLGVTGAVAATPIFFSVSILLIALLQWGLFIIGLLLIAISKWKIFVALKLKFIVLAVAGVVLTPFTAGLIWFLIITLTVLSVISAARDWTRQIFTGAIRRISKLLRHTREISDRLETQWGPVGRLAGFLCEAPLALALPAWGLLELLSFSDGIWGGGPASDISKYVFSLIYGSAAYYRYRKDTDDIEGRPDMDIPDLIVDELDGPL